MSTRTSTFSTDMSLTESDYSRDSGTDDNDRISEQKERRRAILEYIKTIVEGLDHFSDLMKEWDKADNVERMVLAVEFLKIDKRYRYCVVARDHWTRYYPTLAFPNLKKDRSWELRYRLILEKIMEFTRWKEKDVEKWALEHKGPYDREQFDLECCGLFHTNFRFYEFEPQAYHSFWGAGLGREPFGNVPAFFGNPKKLESFLEMFNLSLQHHDTGDEYRGLLLKQKLGGRAARLKGVMNSNSYSEMVSILRAKWGIVPRGNVLLSSELTVGTSKQDTYVSCTLSNGDFRRISESYLCAQEQRERRRKVRLEFLLNDPCPSMNCQSDDHSVIYCPFVGKEQKLEIAKAWQLCFRCFGLRHRAKDCDDQLCSNCGGNHHHTLCSIDDLGDHMKWSQEFREIEGILREDNSVLPLNSLAVPKVNNIVQPDKTVRNKISALVYLEVEIEGKTSIGLLDTGANVNVIPLSYVSRLGLESFPMETKLNTINGDASVDQGVHCSIEIGSEKEKVTFMVSNKCKVPILGIGLIRQFRLVIGYMDSVHQYDPDNGKLVPLEKGVVMMIQEAAEQRALQQEQLECLIRSYHDAFAEDGKDVGKIRTEKCEIRLENELPITLRPYRCSAPDQDNIDKQLLELKQRGFIRDSTSPYSAPIVLVDKKDDGKKARLCVDYRKLNLITLTEHFPMPRIEDIQDKLLNAKFFTTVDIASGFQHIEIRKEDIAKTAFSSNNGHYEWVRMPFGLKNAPVIFQRVIFNLLVRYRLNGFASNYIDDIIVFSKDFESHLEHLRKLFEMLKVENIKLKLSKCEFAKESVRYLGHEISCNAVQPLRSNTLALEKLTPPTDVKTLRGFLGKINYYHKFIPQRAIKLYPLYQLLKKKNPWNWDEDAQNAFEHVKSVLTSSPILRIFDPTKETILYTDASRKGIGAVLRQRDPNSTPDQYVIGYFSKSLLSYQENYSVTELELLAIVEAVDYWHFYLTGVNFTIFTDHQPLKAVKKLTKPNSRLFNWAMRLSLYQFKIEYRPGKDNQDADYLSRHPVEWLRDLVENQVLWIDAKRIEDAQQNVNRDHLPRRVYVKKDLDKTRLVYTKAGLEKDYLPDTLAREVILQLHNDKGHLGCKQMELQFCRKYYNPKLADILREIRDSCEVCLKARKSYNHYGTLGIIGPATKPFEIVHIDTKSGFNNLGSKKNHMHVAIDAATRFAWVVTSRTKESVDYIHLINKVLTFERPQLIVADNYPAIKGKEFRSFLKSRSIEVIYTSTDHASSNGMVERLHQTLTERMRCKRLENAQRAWTMQVQECVDEYNGSIHTVTKFTPKYLMLGIDDEDLFSGESLETAREKAVENSKVSHSTRARYFDVHRRDPDFKVGDKIYVRSKNEKNRKLLDPPFEGPFVVTKKIGHTTCEVDKKGKKERYHVSQFKAVDRPSFVNRSKEPTPMDTLYWE